MKERPIKNHKNISFLGISTVPPSSPQDGAPTFIAPSLRALPGAHTFQKDKKKQRKYYIMVSGR